jgi:hypothetical protein
MAPIWGGGSRSRRPWISWPCLPHALTSANEDYEVGYAAFAFAYSKDNLAHLIHPGWITDEDWAHDLPYLVNEKLAEPVKRLAYGRVRIGPCPYPTLPRYRKVRDTTEARSFVCAADSDRYAGPKYLNDGDNYPRPLD